MNQKLFLKKVNEILNQVQDDMKCLKKKSPIDKIYTIRYIVEYGKRLLHKK